MLARRDQSHLVVIDIQERVAPAVHGREAIIANAIRLVGYAGRLSVPVTFTEHMPERLGATLPELRAAAANDSACLAKIPFSAVREPLIAERFEHARQAGRTQMIVAGMEAHVCVLQTALELLADDFEVLVVADATGSRVPDNRKLSLDRLSKAGAAIVSQEMIVFEWLERGDAAELKDLLPLIK
ncbi:MAG TPA: isochorismatase family protein [Hyphomicrobiaceae bacterium]|nr:isochorismatase family protein [Hyphomicrobiaceae bacterium]